MKVLIIGGAGYIGSHVTREFIDNGYETVVFDNLSSGLRQNIQKESVFFHGDILNIEQIRAVMKTNPGIEAVVHLAASKAAGESMIIPEKYATNNLTGTIQILNAMMEFDIKNIVFSSSAAVYGSPQYLPIDENHPTDPENFYGYTKLEIEQILAWYSKLKGLNYAALRYFNAAGYDPKGRLTGLEIGPQNLLPIIMEAASGMRDKLVVFGDDYDTRDGSCIRDYVHVSDLAWAHVKSLAQISKNKESFFVNLGSDTGISVLEMLEKAREICKVPIISERGPRRPGDPAHLVATSKKAEKLLGFKAQYSSLESLITSTWQAYQANS
jgi:UDP-glucose 4-epimerase